MRGIQVGTNFENELILLVNYFMFIIIYYFIYGFLMPCWLQGIGIEILKKLQGCQSWKPLVWLRTPNIISFSKELKDNILTHGWFIPLERSVGNSATGDGVLKRNSLNRLKQHPQAKSWGPLTLTENSWTNPLHHCGLIKGKADFQELREEDLEVRGDHKLNVPWQGGVLREVSSLSSEQWPDAKTSLANNIYRLLL